MGGPPNLFPKQLGVGPLRHIDVLERLLDGLEKQKGSVVGFWSSGLGFTVLVLEFRV